MDILLLNPLITPDFGLFFWTTLLFIVLWVLLGRFAFKPIVNALQTRENSIADSLKAADKAREEMRTLQSQHEELLRSAREERAQILQEANSVKDKIIAEAKMRADAEFKKKVESAVQEIRNREQEMLLNVKNQVGSMAVEIAEKIIRKELKGSSDHEAYASRLVDEFKMN
jgi:F-type H+-transporting ATPase subunit b